MFVVSWKMDLEPDFVRVTNEHDCEDPVVCCWVGMGVKHDSSVSLDNILQDNLNHNISQSQDKTNENTLTLTLALTLPYTLHPKP